MFKFITRLKWLFSPMYSEGPKITSEEMEIIMVSMYGDQWPARKKELAALMQESSRLKEEKEKERKEKEMIAAADESAQN